MSFWQSLKKAINRTENESDSLLRGMRRRLYRNTDVTIMPFVGYGNPQHIRIRGRVLENHTVRDPRDTDNAVQNLWNIIRRFNSDELPYVSLEVTFQNQTKTTQTDEEGFFDVAFDIDVPLEAIYYQAQFYYSDDRREAHAIGDVIIAPHNAQFAVVSDMDDTVIRSNVPNRIKLVANTLFNNAKTRLPFAGVAEFYRSLQHGTGESFNPIYYVSNSPYNLYDLLQDFFTIRNIPKGPIFLRDFGLTERYIGAADNHKTLQIKELLELHPDLPFILIGDSGEHDPDIYAEIVRQYPDRIAAIYIRDVRPGQAWKLNDHVQEVATKIRSHDIDMLLITDTLAAATHAHEKGFIEADAITDVQAAVESDLPSNAFEAFIDDATS
ncbi:MAG: phosphatase domain-containing protein [Phototrophicaceae bacterium]